MQTDEKAHLRVVTPGTWPELPAEMTVSTHAEVAACPRRWALSAAEYPNVWKGRGYPPKLQVAALAGSIVHLALEIITKQLARSQVLSLTDPRAPQVLKDLGGYTCVVEDCVKRILKRFRENPRALPLMDHAQRTLHGQVPALRARVQSILARLRLPTGGPTSTRSTSKASGPRHPLGKGAYAEVDVRAKSIGWKGKVDLLVLGDDVCEITDFKTGAADDSHNFQVRVYAVLWQLDEELNPTGRIVDRLVLAYEKQDIDVAPPNAKEIEAFARDLLARRKLAETALAARPPEARPDAATCRQCGVRQLCDVYWASASQAVSDDGRHGDVELRITGRHGPTSWDAVVVRARSLPAKSAALLRLRQPEELKTGARVRVIDGAISHDPEDEAAPTIVTLNAVSEVYLVE